MLQSKRPQQPLFSISSIHPICHHLVYWFLVNCHPVVKVFVSEFVRTEDRGLRTGNEEWSTKSGRCIILACQVIRDNVIQVTAEERISQPEETSLRIEWDVAQRTLGIVVGTGHLHAGGVEAAAGDRAGH